MARRLMPMRSIPYRGSNPASVPEPTAPEAEQVPPSAVAVAVAVALERTGHHPAVWFDARVVAVLVVAAEVVPAEQPAVSAGPEAQAQHAVRQGEVVVMSCLPVRPGSRRCYYSPHPIP